MNVLRPISIERHPVTKRLKQRFRDFSHVPTVNLPEKPNLVDGSLPKALPALDHDSVYQREVSTATECHFGAKESRGRLCLRWIILTANRSAEERHAAEKEIDLGTKMFIPDEQLKTRKDRPHTVVRSARCNSCACSGHERRPNLSDIQQGVAQNQQATER